MFAGQLSCKQMSACHCGNNIIYVPGVLFTLVALVLISHPVLGLEMKSHQVISMKDYVYAPSSPLRTHRSRRAVPLNAADRQLLLDKHNALRRLEGAADMEKMIWNDYLTDMARDWAQGCNWAHGQPVRDPAQLPFDYIGQNLYFRTGSADLDGAIQAFYDEKKFYSYASNTCQDREICGHYTQVVWAKSREVGCAVHVCNPLTDPKENKYYDDAHYLVCNYGPAGNFNGEKPYQLGTPCSKCNSGTLWCDNGLCNADCTTGGPGCECKASCANGGCVTDSCTCSCAGGWTGADCSRHCANYHGNCGANPGWPFSWCDRDFVIDNCPLMCQLCYAGSSSPTGCVQPATPTTTPTTTRTITTTSTTTPPMPTTPTTTPRNVQPTTTTTQAPTTTTRNPCADWTCMNGGSAQVQQGTSCRCQCEAGWQGERCTQSEDEARVGVILKFLAPLSTWDRLWQFIRPLVVRAVNNFCYSYTDICCGTTRVDGRQLSQGLQFLSDAYLSVGQGYPEQQTYEGRPLTVALLYAQGAPGNSLCQQARELSNQRTKRSVTANDASSLSQDALYSVVQNVQANISEAARSCCDVSLLSMEKARVEREQQVSDPGLPLPLVITLAALGGLCLFVLVGTVIGLTLCKRSRVSNAKSDTAVSSPDNASPS